MFVMSFSRVSWLRFVLLDLELPHVTWTLKTQHRVAARPGASSL